MPHLSLIRVENTSIESVLELPSRGKSGEMEVLGLFACALRKLGIDFERDDPYIKFEYKGRPWTIKHFYAREKGVVVNGIEHNCDLVIWSGEDYVAYVEVKMVAGDLHPDQSREFLGKVLWKHVDDAIFVSTRSTINRWQLLERYGVRSTRHLLEAKNQGLEYPEWPEYVVKKFIEEDLGSCKVKETAAKVIPERRGKCVQLISENTHYDGRGFRFTETVGYKEVRYYLADEDHVLHSPYAMLTRDGRSALIFKKDEEVQIADLYQAYATKVDLGANDVFFLEPVKGSSGFKSLFASMEFRAATEDELNSAYGFRIESLPAFGWEKVMSYPKTDLLGANPSDFPNCVQNALKGVPDGIYETATFLSTVFKAAGLHFDENDFAENCWKRIEEHWLGFEPAKTKKDTYAKVKSACSTVQGRNIHPPFLDCCMDTPGLKGPKTLGALFHMQLKCAGCPSDEVYDAIVRARRNTHAVSSVVSK